MSCRHPGTSSKEYLPDREHRFAVLVELVKAQGAPNPRVLDLACGTGSITTRVLRAIPSAQVVAADVDPALLTFARGTFDGDPRVRVVATDLADPHWATELPAGRFDAVLTATALHWLQPAQLQRLYVDLAALLRPGGLFANVDTMPTTESALGRAVATLRQEGMSGTNPWRAWWAAVALDPRLKAAVDERLLRPGDPGYDAAFAAYRKRWPRIRLAEDSPLVRVRFDSHPK